MWFELRNLKTSEAKRKSFVLLLLFVAYFPSKLSGRIVQLLRKENKKRSGNPFHCMSYRAQFQLIMHLCEAERNFLYE